MSTGGEQKQSTGSLTRAEKAEQEKAEKVADRADREKLQAAVDQFDKKKWDEIARWMQKHKYFTRHLQQARLHVRIQRQTFSSVRQYFPGRVLRKMIASKSFAEKFGLKFSKSTSEILLVGMHKQAHPKPDPKKNLGRMYFLQVAFTDESKTDLRLAKVNTNGINVDDPYVWVFEGSVLWRHILLGTLLVIFFLLCLFPVWPAIVKQGVWYLSVTLLLFIFAFIIVRALIFLVLWIAGYNFWILPNVFDDELPPSESFSPLYSFEPHRKSRSAWMYRISVGIVLFAMTYWVYVQPNAYHAQMLDEQRSFVDDLYSGKFLSDRSEASSANLDEVIPDYDELLQEDIAESELTEEEKAAQDILDQILKEDEDLYADDDEENEDTEVDDGN